MKVHIPVTVFLQSVAMTNSIRE